MKKLSALLLSLLLLLTACGTPATPGAAVTLPTPNDEILVEEGLHAEDLPEVCRLWFDLAETSGAADKNSHLPLASRADEGACDYLAVRLPDGTYTDLIQEGELADEGITLADFSGGRAKQEGSYGQLAWNGELYHAFTVSAADCTLPNLTAPEGGILRLNISGDCTVDGGGTEYACFEGFDCVLVTGGGTLTVLNAAALDCGGGDLPIPSLVLDGDVTLRCDDIRLAAPNTVDVPVLAVLSGTLCTDMLWLSNGMLINAGGTLSVQGSVQELKRAVFRGGTTLLGAAEQKAEFTLSGGTAHLAGGLAEGSTVEGGAGVFSAQSFSGAAVNDYGAVLWDGADGSAYRGAYGTGYYPTDYSPEWAGAVSGTAWDALTVAAPAGLLIYLLGNCTVGDTTLLAHGAAALDPLGRALGLDGMILLAFLLGFPANEIVLPILLMGYSSAGTLVDGASLAELKTMLLANGWTGTTALCMLLFSLFHFPCGTTTLTLARESKSLKWTLVGVALPTAVGMTVCFAVHLAATWLKI